MLDRLHKQYRKVNQLLKKSIFKSHILNDQQVFLKNIINNQGIYIGKSNDLNSLGIDLKWLDHKKKLISILDQINNDQAKNKIKGSYVVGVKKIPDNILIDIYNFALNKKLIELFENYFELGLKFRGVDLRKDLNDNQNIETRIWHIDGEDSKIIKILFYLDEVNKTNGPFSFIKKNDLPRKNNLKKEKDGRILESEIKKEIETNKLNQFLSENGDFAIVDTCNIYHKGELPVSKPRYAIFFCYNTNYPIMPDYCKKLHPVNEYIKKNYPKKYLST